MLDSALLGAPVLDHRLEITGAPASRRLRRDADGNVVALLQAESVPHVIEFKLAALVERVRGDGPTVLPARALHSRRRVRPTRLTAADDHLRPLARRIAAESAGEAPEDIAVLV